MIADIFQYDSLKESKLKRNIVLSYNKEFKDKFLSKHSDEINIGFKEDSYLDISPEDMLSYFQYFLKVLPDIDCIYIDCDDYSIGYRVIQSAALDVPSIKDIKLYASDTDNPMAFYILQDIAGKEKAYSRQQFLIS